MNAKFLALPALLAVSLGGSAAAFAQDGSEPAASVYHGRVDPSAFRTYRFEHRKHGTTVDPAMVRLITPGVDKFTIYRLIGPPNFAAGITRTWNYLLSFPTSAGSAERVRCRMQIRFIRERGQYDVVVSDVIWQDQACADRVAQAS